MPNYYDKVIAVVKDYLGPAAERFISRQLEFHLDRQEKNISADEIPKVVEWVRVGLGLITRDKKSVEECAGRLVALKA